jgi:hypothetical protein
MAMTFKPWIGCLLALGLAAGSSASCAASASPAPARQTAASSSSRESSEATNRVSLKLAQAPSAAPSPTPTAPAAAPANSVGTVVSVQGNATATRNGTNLALKANDEIFKGDTLKTAANSALGIIFDDETTFNLKANASITVDEFVYQEGGSNNAAAFNVVAGTVAFVANAVAKTGDMTISTPVSTLGIRGTTGLVEVGPPGAGGAVTDNIKLYPDADGRVGRIEIRGRDGSALGFLTRGATGFAVRGGAGVRPTAVALRISPQQIARDQVFVRQTHQAQSSGRNIVTQRRLRQPGTPNQQPLRPQQQLRQQQQSRPQQSPTLQRPGQLTPNGLKQTPRTQQPTAPGPQQPQRQLQPQQRLPSPQLQPQRPPQAPQRPAQLPPRPTLQQQRPTLQPQGPRPGQRLAVPPGRKPAPAQKKRKPE